MIEFVGGHAVVRGDLFNDLCLGAGIVGFEDGHHLVKKVKVGLVDAGADAVSSHGREQGDEVIERLNLMGDGVAAAVVREIAIVVGCLREVAFKNQKARVFQFAVRKRELHFLGVGVNVGDGLHEIVDVRAVVGDLIEGVEMQIDGADGGADIEAVGVFIKGEVVGEGGFERGGDVLFTLGEGRGGEEGEGEGKGEDEGDAFAHEGIPPLSRRGRVF